MKNIRKLSREDRKKISAGDLSPAFCIEGGSPGTGGCSDGHICSGGRCIPYVDPGNGGGGSGGGGDSYTCICPWGTFTQSTPCPEFYCITG